MEPLAVSWVAVTPLFRPVAVSLLFCLSAFATTPAFEPQQSDVELQCREWAESFFHAPTPAKERELARCIAERDPDSAGTREAAKIGEAVRTQHETMPAGDWTERAGRYAAEATAKCGGLLIPAYGVLDFCDSPQAVRWKASVTEGIECTSSKGCSRLKVTTRSVPLTFYPKYLGGRLHRLVFYTPERTSADYNAGVRRDWEALVAVAEAEFGSTDVEPAPFPDFFAVDDVYVANTHRWDLGKKRVRVGVFEGGETYAGIMVIESALQEPDRDPSIDPAWGRGVSIR